MWINTNLEVSICGYLPINSGRSFLTLFHNRMISRTYVEIKLFEGICIWSFLISQTNSGELSYIVFYITVLSSMHYYDKKTAYCAEQAMLKIALKLIGISNCHIQYMSGTQRKCGLELPIRNHQAERFSEKWRDKGLLCDRLSCTLSVRTLTIFFFNLNWGQTNVLEMYVERFRCVCKNITWVENWTTQSCLMAVVYH